MEINKMSKSLNAVTGLGLSLLMGASSILVQGCKNTADGSDTTKNDQISYNLLTFDGAVTGSTGNLTGKEGSTDYSAIGSDGDKYVYLGVNSVKGVLTTFDGKSAQHHDMKANDEADNTKPDDFNFQLGGAWGKDGAVITHIVGNGKGVVVAVNGLGRYRMDRLNNHGGGVIEVEGDTFIGGWRNTDPFFPDLKWTRDNVTALTADENGWKVFFNNTAARSSAQKAWGTLDPAKAFVELEDNIVTAAVSGNGSTFLATKGGQVVKMVSGKAGEVIITAEILGIADLEGAITSLAIAGDWLVVGLKAFADVANSGGLYARNLNNGKTARYGEGLLISVRNITVAPDKTAMAAADKGFVFFADGDFAASNNLKATFPVEKATETRPAFNANAPAGFGKGVIGFAFANGQWYAAIPGEPVQAIKVTQKDRPKEDSTK